LTPRPGRYTRAAQPLRGRGGIGKEAGADVGRWARGVATAVAGLLATGRAAWAQTTEPPPDAGGGLHLDVSGLAGEIARAVLATFEQWLETYGPSALIRLVGLVAGTLTRFVVEATGGAVGVGGGLLVQLPLELVTREPWVAGVATTLRDASMIALGGAMILGFLGALAGSVFGFTHDEFLRVVPVGIAAGLGMRVSLGLIERFVAGANALSLSLVDPSIGLPGWREMSAVDFNTGYGLVALLYAGCGLLLLLSRLYLLGLAVVCTVTAAPAILLGLIPGLSHFFHWWLRTLLSVVIVQIPQALAFGYGASLVARYGAGAGVFTLLAGIAMMWLAFRLPGMLPGMAHGPGSLRQSVAWARDLAILAAAAPAVAAAPRAGIAPEGGAGQRTAGVIHGSGPTVYRRGPILPAPLDVSLPAPRRWTTLSPGLAVRSGSESPAESHPR
jgi:hypothetical protein